MTKNKKDQMKPQAKASEPAEQPSAGAATPTAQEEAVNNSAAAEQETAATAEAAPAEAAEAAKDTEAAAVQQSETQDKATETDPATAEPSEAEILRQAVLNGDFDINDFLNQFKEAQSAKDEAEAKVIRLQADFENLRRRSKMDTEAAIHRAAADLIGSILPVVDNFERAWRSMDEGPDKEGVALIARQLLDVLRNAGLTEIQAEGMDFDPKLHHAVSQADVGPEMKGKVTMVLQKGYLLHDKLLRAPMVQVGI